MRNSEFLTPGTIVHGISCNYIIKEVLGQGSFGIVYLAQIVIKGSLGELSCNNYVALKEFFIRGISFRQENDVRTEYYDKYAQHRNNFISEANYLSKLNHPNIVKVLESFKDYNTLYFSMEYIDDVNLNEYILSNNVFSEREALTSILQIANAISFMHIHKMLHRDLKPSNIMRRQNGDWVIIDLGLSKHFNSDNKSDDAFILNGGSMSYAPLEQFEEKTRIIFNPSIDIYALGAILFKMLTGSTPPNTLTIIKEGLPIDFMKKQNLTDRIISFISRAMHPNASKRINSIDEFIGEVRLILPSSSTNNYPTIIKSPNFNEMAPTADYEIYNGFTINWKPYTPIVVRSNIKALFDVMQKIGDKETFFYGEYGFEHASTIPIMSLGLNSLELYKTYIKANAMRPSENSTIPLILSFLQEISLYTSLYFRLASEDEILNKNQSSDTTLPFLCYSKEEGLVYRDSTTNGKFIPFNIYSLHTNFNFQIICEGNKPIFDANYFNIPCSQERVEEIYPIGFGFYAIRKGLFWNVSSPKFPGYSFLKTDYESISSINLMHIPGPGLYTGWTYLGLEAKIGDFSSFYIYKNEEFILKETLSSAEIEEHCYLT